MQIEKCLFIQDFDILIDNDLNKKYSEVKFNNEENLTLDIIKEYQEFNCNNKLLFLIHSLILSITHFCKTTYYMIYNNKNSNSFIFLNEYIKRYKSYVDFATYMNTKLENINVSINYLYDYFYKYRDGYAKFTILRMFVSLIILLIKLNILFIYNCAFIKMLIWNKEVTSRLKNLSSDNLIIEKLSTLIYEELAHGYNVQKNSMIVEYDSDSSRYSDNCSFLIEL